MKKKIANVSCVKEITLKYQSLQNSITVLQKKTINRIQLGKRGEWEMKQ